MISYYKLWFFLVFCGLGALLPQLSPFLFRDLGFSDPGFIFLLGQFGVGCGALAAGYISDKTLNVRTLQLSATVPLVFSVYLIAGIPSFTLEPDIKLYLLCVLWFIACLCFGSILPLGNVSFLQNQNKPEDYGRVRLFGTIGFLFSNVILIFFLNTPKNIIAYSSLFFVLSGFSLFLLPSGRNISSKDQQVSISIKIIYELLRNRRISIYLFLQFIFFVHFSPAEFVLSTYIQNVDVSIFDYPLAPIPLAWALGTVVEIFFLFFSTNLFKKIGAYPFLYLAFAVGTLRFLIMAILPLGEWIVFLQFLHGFHFSAALVGGILYIREIVEPRKLATCFALVIILGRSMGIGLGSFFLSRLAGDGHFQNLFMICSLLGFLGLLLSFAASNILNQTNKYSKPA